MARSRNQDQEDPLDSLLDYESESPVDSPNRFERPVDVPDSRRRKTLAKSSKAAEIDLLLVEFQELFAKDLKQLYKEVVKVIEALRNKKKEAFV
jgi:hypothetical protein